MEIRKEATSERFNKFNNTISLTRFSYYEIKTNY